MIPQGYKKTEIGIIPKDWQELAVKDVAEILNGDRGVNYPSRKDFIEVGIPFINAGHLKHGTIDFSDMDYITNEKYNVNRENTYEQ